jgi:WD40 repeat protein
LWDLAWRKQKRSLQLPVLSAAALSPDGRYLAWVSHDPKHSPAAIDFHDLEKWEPAGSVEWDLEDDVRDLAFSPDGQTLATGSWEGVVKLIPWRLLLGL